MTEHLLLHGIKATNCTSDWNLMRGGKHCRTCHRCERPVFDLNNLNDTDNKAILCSNGLNPGRSRLHRRSDGRYIIGDCAGSYLPSKITAAGFVSLPFACHFLWGAPMAILKPETICTYGLSLAWALIGALLTSRTRSGTLCGVLFVVFILQSLIVAIIRF